MKWVHDLEVTDVLMLIIVGGITAPLWGFGVVMVIGALTGRCLS